MGNQSGTSDCGVRRDIFSSKSLSHSSSQSFEEVGVDREQRVSNIAAKVSEEFAEM